MYTNGVFGMVESEGMCFSFDVMGFRSLISYLLMWAVG
jgi:hypothetical protein